MPCHTLSLLPSTHVPHLPDPTLPSLTLPYPLIISLMLRYPLLPSPSLPSLPVRESVYLYAHTNRFGRQKDGQLHIQRACTRRQTNGRMDWLTDRQTDRQTDRYWNSRYVCVCVCVYAVSMSAWLIGRLSEMNFVCMYVCMYEYVPPVCLKVTRYVAPACKRLHTRYLNTVIFQ